MRRFSYWSCISIKTFTGSAGRNETGRGGSCWRLPSWVRRSSRNPGAGNSGVPRCSCRISQVFLRALCSGVPPGSLYPGLKAVPNKNNIKLRLRRTVDTPSSMSSFIPLYFVLQSTIYHICKERKSLFA